MLPPNKILPFILFIFVFVNNTTAADINISGPTTVCPGIQYSYTASASNIFGDRDGCFAWSFFENGQWVPGPGSLPCPCGNSSSSNTITKTWANTGTVKLRATFVPKNDPFCPLSSETIDINVRVFAPGEPRDSNGNLTFCSSGQTKTITIPGIPDLDPGTCNWHHKYDWIVPAGWSVSAEFFSNIPGGIRTSSTSVEVTTPSSALAQGYTGNYFITVKTEPAWPWPMQSSRQIFVGEFATTQITVDGTYGVCPGNIYVYNAEVPGGDQPGYSYSWTYPDNWSCNSCGDSPQISLITPSYSTPDAGTVEVSVNNGCGASGYTGITVYPLGTYACGGYNFSAHPNPADNTLTISATENNKATKNGLNLNEEYVVELFNEFAKKVKNIESKKKEIVINTARLPEGLYMLKITYKDGIIEERVIIEH